MEESSDIQIEDLENFGKGNEAFSHSMLVMKALVNCQSAGSREMREGYFNIKTDRFGNQMKVYVEDTRHAFIECVRSAIMMMSCDLDKEAKDEIKKIKETLTEKFKDLCEKEKHDIESAPPILKKARLAKGIYLREGSLNKSLHYYQEYVEIEIESYRKIVCELVDLSQRKDFFAGEDVGA